VEFGSFSAAYSFSSRFEEGSGTNPEELIAAAHAGCYSMALSNILATAGSTPTKVETTAQVSLEVGADGAAITGIELTCVAVVPGISDAAFLEHANAAKVGCPVSKALSATPITLTATLQS
jgi:osmotically inducible protein OsmC